MKLRGYINENGRLEFAGSKPWVLMMISSTFPAGSEVDINITIHVEKRTNQQNKYYWAVVVQLVMEGLKDAGFDEIKTLEDAHEVLKSMFWKKQIYSEKHDTLEMYISSTKFPKHEFMQIIETQIVPWAFDYLGITIPPPNSQAALSF